MRQWAMTDEQFEKLPKYAQREIFRLQADLKSAKQKLAAMESDDPTTEVWVGDWHAPNGGIPLPPGSRIQFRLGDDKTNSYPSVEVRAKDNHVTVSYNGHHGNKRVAVFPVVSNSFEIREVEA